jgi:hypothetical protein
MDSVHTQPSNIQEAVNPGVRTTEAVDPLASATRPVGDGQLVAPTGSKGSASIFDLNLTIPQKSGGQMDIEMPGATSGVSYNQVLQGLNGGLQRVPAISLVGNGVDGEDQTAAGESAGGKEPPMVSTEMEVNTLDGNKGSETSPAWKGPIQSSMVSPRISQHILIDETHLAYINLDLYTIKGIKNSRPRSGGNGETFGSMAVNHRNQGESPSTKVYECIPNFQKYLHKADPLATIDPLYNKEEEDDHMVVPNNNSPSSLAICSAFTITNRSATRTQ